MKKLTKLQKKWIEAYHPTDDIFSPIYLLILLLNLKAIKFETFCLTKDNIIDNVKMWSSLYTKYKLQKQFKQQDFSKPPKSIKPT